MVGDAMPASAFCFSKFLRMLQSIRSSSPHLLLLLLERPDAFVRSFVRSFIRSFVHSFNQSMITHSFVHSFIQSVIQSINHSFIHKFMMVINGNDDDDDDGDDDDVEYESSIAIKYFLAIFMQMRNLS